MSAAEPALGAAVLKTFSDMAFIDVAPSPVCEETISYSHILSIALRQPVVGGLALYLPSECKRMIVENIYGEEWEQLSGVQIDDCLLELLNVLAGNFLNEYCGAGLQHNISLPELIFDETELQRPEEVNEYLYDAEGVCFKVVLGIP